MLRQSLLTLILLLPFSVQAATLTVDTETDELNSNGNCSLREAIESINDGSDQGGCGGSDYGTDDTIIIPAGTYKIERTGDGENSNSTGDFDIRAAVTLRGAGASTTTIDGDDDDRLFHIDPASSGFDVVIEGLTITDGLLTPSGAGAGINKTGNGTLTLRNSVVSLNIANGSGGGLSLGGGNAVIENTTFSQNSAPFGGGIHQSVAGNVLVKDSLIVDNDAFQQNGGGIQSSAGMVIVNSTISGNQCDFDGGGIFAGGNLTLLNVTVTDNSADTQTNDVGDGGGIARSAGTITIQNSIIAGNTDLTPGGGTVTPDCFDNAGGNIDSQGYNIIGDDTGCAGQFDGAGDLVDEDPLLNALADNGGDTETHLPQSNSPAIDAGNPSGCVDEDDATLTSDQRGFTRPADGDGDGTLRCDIGAVEVGCGNGDVETGEDCDDAGESATCNADCTDASCGDGTVNSTSGEECDDGNTDNGDGCSSSCLNETGSTGGGTGGANAVCGDGTVQGSEQCDDGNTDSGDGCSAVCNLEQASDLASANPDVDFSNLTEGETVTITSPNSSTSSLVVQQQAATCTCTWSVNPSARGDYDDETACTSDFTPGPEGTGQISVEEDCGAGASTFNQSIVVNAATTGGTGGGCSLIRR